MGSNDLESAGSPSRKSRETVVSTITDEQLLKGNKTAMILHACQATLMLATYMAVDSVRDFSKPVLYT